MRTSAEYKEFWNSLQQFISDPFESASLCAVNQIGHYRIQASATTAIKERIRLAIKSNPADQEIQRLGSLALAILGLSSSSDLQMKVLADNFRKCENNQETRLHVLFLDLLWTQPELFKLLCGALNNSRSRAIQHISFSPGLSQLQETEFNALFNPISTLKPASLYLNNTLRFGELKPSSLQLLAAVIQNLTDKLDLSNNDLGSNNPVLFKFLCLAIRKSNITTLVLTNNKFDQLPPALLTALADAITSNTTLIKVEGLPDNIPPEVAAALQRNARFAAEAVVKVEDAQVTAVPLAFNH